LEFPDSGDPAVLDFPYPVLGRTIFPPCSAEQVPAWYANYAKQGMHQSGILHHLSVYQPAFSHTPLSKPAKILSLSPVNVAYLPANDPF